MARFSAFLDACVLVPIALADTLLRLAEADLYRPLWSVRVLDEMVEAIETVHPDLAGAAKARADAMRAAFDDACVTGWEPLESGINLPDPDDFLLYQLDLEPDLTMATLHRQAAATKRPAITTPVLLEHLAKCGVPGFASEAPHQLWRGR